MTQWAFLLLFGSGFSALAYQVVWMRELRLVFGASTAATGAVSALFMAGLGIGGWLLGSRADKHARPLLLYGRLELAISFFAAISPWLLQVARGYYLESGGMLVLGFWGATGARLALAAVVLGVPTFLMGGTLPAAVRAVTTESDSSRRLMGALYGANTLGALTGVVLTNFVLLEALGARGTLYVAILLNVLVAVAAMSAGGKGEAVAIAAEPPPLPVPEGARPGTAEEETADTGGISSRLALLVAAGAGFAFFLMELVWYRMLGPVLGGSTYTFGLILAVALAGIGLGGAAYPVIMRGVKPSSGLLAATCLLEALAMLVPYAVGDDVAAIAAQTRPLAAMGFNGLLVSWTLISLGVVFPAAFISGVQFPLLIALLGRGSRDVGKQTGRAYACNTAGAIVGSLAGGFGLLPWLSAPGCWLLSAGLLALLGLAIAIHSLRSPAMSGTERRPFALALALLVLLLALCVAATGPTAAWRHSPVGAGRIAVASTRQAIRDWQANTRWNTLWEADGVESSVAIHVGNGYSFLINGKSDGSVYGDRGTQIMVGMIGAALHPAPKSAMVVGLGTGCTAGWLSAVEGMEAVDVVELEPAVLEMARLCADANQDVVGRAERGEGVRIIINDAREVLTTVPEKYDLIVSEPSNPYRAGIASLFTREFYTEVRNRLNPGGYFITWCQGYEIATGTFLSIASTLRSVFPYTECWATQGGDLMFLATMEPVAPKPEDVRGRLGERTFRDAMRIAWGCEGLEGLLAHYVARSEFVDAMIDGGEAGINTDDLMLIEYDFARTVGRRMNFSPAALHESSRLRRSIIPAWAENGVDMDLVLANFAFAFRQGRLTGPMSEEYVRRAAAVAGWMREGGGAADLPPAANWLRIERLAHAENLAEAGNESALEQIAFFEDWWPASAAAVRSRLAFRRGDTDLAAAEFAAMCDRLRRSPWEILDATVFRMFPLLSSLAGSSPENAARLYAALETPFSLHVLESVRRFALLEAADFLDAKKREAVLARWFEPNPPQELKVLVGRVETYKETGNPLLPKAERELAEFGASIELDLESRLRAREQKEP